MEALLTLCPRERDRPSPHPHLFCNTAQLLPLELRQQKPSYHMASCSVSQFDGDHVDPKETQSPQAGFGVPAWTCKRFCMAMWYCYHPCMALVLVVYMWQSACNSAIGYRPTPCTNKTAMLHLSLRKDAKSILGVQLSLAKLHDQITL